MQAGLSELILLCAAAALSTVLSLPVNAASKFDPNYYAVLYPDVVALLGADPQVLFNHYTKIAFCCSKRETILI